jgi:hypothetical protein
LVARRQSNHANAGRVEWLCLKKIKHGSQPRCHGALTPAFSWDSIPPLPILPQRAVG